MVNYEYLFIAYYFVGLILATYEYQKRSKVKDMGIDPSIIFLAILFLAFIQLPILIIRKIKK